jgi:hypothetical protein
LAPQNYKIHTSFLSQNELLVFHFIELYVTVDLKNKIVVTNAPIKVTASEAVGGRSGINGYSAGITGISSGMWMEWDSAWNSSQNCLGLIKICYEALS